MVHRSRSADSPAWHLDRDSRRRGHRNYVRYRNVTGSSFNGLGCAAMLAATLALTSAGDVHMIEGDRAMTGYCLTSLRNHQVTFGFRDNLSPVQPGHDPETVGLPLNQTTLADRPRKHGYTTGLIGKWHLGERPQFHPTKRGFDEFWGWLGGAHDYFRAEPGGDKQMAGPILCNFKEPAPLTYLTDDQGDESVDFIRRHKDRPFFLFTSFAAPHTPMQAIEEDLKRFSHIENKLRRTYCAMVYRLDHNVGKILAELRAQGLERDTFVVFLSDNEGQSAPGMSNGSVNAPFRGGKTLVLEGGIRVPIIFKWPATLPAGKTVDETISALDFVPTFVNAAGGSIQPSDRLHGVNLLPLPSPNDVYFIPAATAALIGLWD